MSGVPILSILVALPLFAGVLALFQSANGARWNALITTLVSFAIGVAIRWDFIANDVRLWIAALLVQSLPYAAAVIMSLVSSAKPFQGKTSTDASAPATSAG